jgi:hypothetical protein
MRGIALKQKFDPRSAVHLTEWLRKLRLDHADRILTITDKIAVEWGRSLPYVRAAMPTA